MAWEMIRCRWAFPPRSRNACSINGFILVCEGNVCSGIRVIVALVQGEEDGVAIAAGEDDRLGPVRVAVASANGPACTQPCQLLQGDLGAPFSLANELVKPGAS